MEVVRPNFVPDPSLSRGEMESLQRDIAAAAQFDTTDAALSAVGTPENGTDPSDPHEWTDTRTDETDLLVAGVDQAFDGEDATSAVVLVRNGETVERVHATERTEIPYIPGLLSFREGPSILAALGKLDRDPDVLLVDGSGRIHYREAGLATHIGVMLDVPAVGVAKNLLCGQPRESLDDPLPEGERVPIEADEDVTAPDGTVIGYAVQTRQFSSGNRYINPVYVSPGHRVDAETAAALAEVTVDEYKLPEPIRRADAYAAELTG
ncbi:endonuclease V [Halovenus marina]|uniref:endonuclease V n=1 Tax=Halovenus marina TaxID=3396621 RepID=UPI003F561455